ncbi:MAG: DUF359 domain-containing protein [Hadesarchaea archaeon]|nr:MAG: DUF359 domain-containing protein [Hadesarchaea archaeon]
MRLPEHLRDRLKKPWGRVFPDMREALGYVRSLRPVRIVTVGDRVTATLLEEGVRPDVCVVDFKTLRSPLSGEERRRLEELDLPERRVVNPPAVLSRELWEAFDLPPPLKIVVEGEEDLATLAAVVKSPPGTVVLYGQPGEGVVVVEVERVRREVEALLREFGGGPPAPR